MGFISINSFCENSCLRKKKEKKRKKPTNLGKSYIDTVNGANFSARNSI